MEQNEAGQSGTGRNGIQKFETRDGTELSKKNYAGRDRTGRFFCRPAELWQTLPGYR
jgi:hypothetical protein